MSSEIRNILAHEKIIRYRNHETTIQTNPGYNRILLKTKYDAYVAEINET